MIVSSRVKGAAGRVQVRWGDPADGQLQFAAPHGYAVDSAGNVYISEVRQAAGADPAEWRKAVRKLVRVA
jgi:hypothetical protein